MPDATDLFMGHKEHVWLSWYFLLYLSNASFLNNGSTDKVVEPH